MKLATWGKGLLLWGIVAAIVSGAPALLLTLLPAQFGAGFIGLLAIMLSLSVTPLAVVVASVGAILLLVALVRRGRS
jgi:hypothetical protein